MERRRNGFRRPSASTRSTSLPNSAFNSSCMSTKSNRLHRASGRKVTRTSTSLTGRNSSRNTDPKGRTPGSSNACRTRRSCAHRSKSWHPSMWLPVSRALSARRAARVRRYIPRRAHWYLYTHLRSWVQVISVVVAQGAGAMGNGVIHRPWRSPRLPRGSAPVRPSAVPPGSSESGKTAHVLTLRFATTLLTRRSPRRALLHLPFGDPSALEEPRFPCLKKFSSHLHDLLIFPQYFTRQSVTSPGLDRISQPHNHFQEELR
jgi:hypothetical protein